MKLLKARSVITFFKALIFFLTHFLIISSSFAQQKVTGRVLDSVTGESLAFVNISAGGSYGTTTNIDGIFSFEIPLETRSVKFSFIGYESINFPINQQFNYPTLTIYLNPSSVYLNEIIVSANRPNNPARAIIRQVIKNKELNRPESLPFFSFNAYKKIILNPVFNEPHAFKKLQESYKTRYMGVMETSSSVYYEPEKGFREEIEAIQASGLKEPRFATVTNQIPFFSFYQESFEILEKSFFSPIANGSLRRYDYQLTDTLFSGTDSVFVIAYQPKKGRKFDGLEGLLYINNNGFAIQNVIAEPSNNEFVEMRLEQQYDKVDGKWFPEQILYRIQLPEYPSKELGLSVENRIYISDIQFEEPAEKPKWGSASIKVKSTAYQRDSIKWQKLRIKPLDSLEKSTYQYMDSVSKKLGLRFLENVFNSSLDGLYPIGSLSLRVGDLIHYNEHEGLRPGIGLQTNSSLSSRFSLGGYVGIGFRDESIKYSGDFTTLLVPSKDMKLKLSYYKTVQEPAIIEADGSNFLQAGYSRRLMASRMNEVNSWQGELSFRPIKRIVTSVEVQQTDIEPLYEYTFQSEVSNPFSSFQYSQARVKVAYTASNNLLVQDASRQTTAVQSTPAIFSFYFDKGNISVSGQDLSYERYQAIFYKKLLLKGGSYFSVRLEGGLVNGEVPYPLLFNGAGSKASNYAWIDATNTFRTMGIYEFLHDRFVHMFFTVGTGRPMFKLGIIHPEPILIHGSSWGALTNRESHHQIEFLEANKGYHETGIQLHNILGISYLNIAKLGLGGGVYYRHGAYAFTETKDNLSYKFLMKFYF